MNALEPLHSSGESSSNSSFFSPISGSWFGKNSNGGHDTSWIGARLSPIRSLNDDDDDNDSPGEIEPLHVSVLKDAQFVHEATPLFMANGSHYQRRKASNLDGNGAGIHPMWNAHNRPPTPHALAPQNGLVPSRWKNNSIGVVMVVLSAVQLALAYTQTCYLWYLSRRRHDDSFAWGASSATSWLPDKVLWRCGAWRPITDLYDSTIRERVMGVDGSWRYVTSATLCTSVWQYVVLLLAWIFMTYGRPSNNDNQCKSWTTGWATYIGAVVTGHLWLQAFDLGAHQLQGCGTALWGTGGVLCGFGVRYRHRRVVACMLCSVMVILCLLLERPRYNSVVAVLGSMAFGGAIHVGHADKGLIGAAVSSSSWWSTFISRGGAAGALITVLVLATPVLWIGLRAYFR